MKEKYFSLLKQISKPACYIGEEFNIVKKQWDNDSLKIALVFPDAYVVGESSLSLKILYDLLNKNPYFIAERFFAPAVDFENKLSENNLPLLSMENFRALKDFDIIGFTIQHELTYTNILSILNLSALAFRSDERNDSDPIICAGGPGVFNPEPLADAFDFFYLGEAENSVGEVFEKIRKLKKENKTKNKILEEISEYKGIYTPKFYSFSYDASGKIIKVDSKYNKNIFKQIVKDFDDVAPPQKPLVPYVETIHDRAAVEIFRGCTRGCRFCQAGMIYRPVRERSLDNVLKYACSAIKGTGFEEISFVSLNCADYSAIVPLILNIKNKLKNISVSLPSLRVDSFTSELAHALSIGKRSSVTFAPEAGSQTLRDRINKIATEEDILKALNIAKKYGWKLVKLYFMIGLPGEVYEDLDGIVNLVRKILKDTGLNLNISIAVFVPKPHTPFQWYGQIPVEVANDKIMYLRKRLKHGKIKLSFHNTKQSFIEAALARGDRKLFEAIEQAFKLGCRFDGWSDNFNFDAWVSAFNICGILPESYAQRNIAYNEITPWDHINCGVSREFLVDEDIKSKNGIISGDCRWQNCLNCGACSGEVKNILKDKCMEALQYTPAKQKNNNQNYRYRIKYAKGKNLKFIGHLDLLRLLIRIINRSGIPAAYKGQFHPRMRISTSYPLGLFYISNCEYFDIELTSRLSQTELLEKLKNQLPDGLQILDVKEISSAEKSLMQCFKEVDYEAILKNDIGNIDEHIENLLSLKNVYLERKNKEIEINKLIKSIKYVKNNKIFITLNIVENGGIKPTDVIDMLGVNSNEVDEIRRVEFKQ